jgi:hypothetical protein
MALSMRAGMTAAPAFTVLGEVIRPHPAAAPAARRLERLPVRPALPALLLPRLAGRRVEVLHGPRGAGQPGGDEHAAAGRRRPQRHDLLAWRDRQPLHRGLTGAGSRQPTSWRSTTAACSTAADPPGRCPTSKCLKGLECQVSKTVNSDACARPTTLQPRARAHLPPRAAPAHLFLLGQRLRRRQPLADRGWGSNQGWGNEACQRGRAVSAAESP